MSVAKGKSGKLETRLASIELKVGQVNKRLRNTKHQLGELRAKLQPLKFRKLELTKDLEDQKTALSRQLRAAYATGRQEKLKLALNQQDPYSIGRTLAYYRYFNDGRTRQISAVNKTLAELQAIEQDIRLKTQDLQSLSTQLQKQRGAFEATRNQRNTVLLALKKEISQQDNTLNSLLDDETELQRLLRYLQTVLADIPADNQGYSSFPKAKGKLAWPIQGRVRKLFGKNRSHATDRLKWQGVIIEAEIGKDIRAIANGQIAFSDWIPRYGLLIIIDHGDGYMSLYGYNQSLYKSAGEWVERGELIANVGDSGGQDDPGLYFEIRYNSKPLNPGAWCSSKIKMSRTSYN
ncbi:MAG: peptidoglycan DD-metalloendopeptidase family protein [Pseudomonadota bacterium]